SGDVYKGVFLDQGWPFWDPPYYSVRAPQTQIISFHNRPFTWYFQGWEGVEVEFEDSEARETAAIFRDADAEVRALYKGHLASSNREATTHNNGRRIVRDSEGLLHAVYEDNQQIWYTYSEDEGETWAEEILVEGSESDVGSQYLYPAITENDGKLHVAYTEIFYFEGEPDHFYLYYRSKVIGGGDRSERVIVEQISDLQLIRVPKPAIEIWKLGSDVYVIIVINLPDQSLQIATYYKKTPETLIPSTPLPGSIPLPGC
ncbi:MAG: hypothetical protein ACE5GL_07495, partial [Calditrichia bacterium]